MKQIVAVPSALPGGLNSAIGAHFGHCDVYTIITVENGTVESVEMLPSVPHQQGGCMAPVQHLAQNGVNVLISGGMGMRPLMGFNQVGIDVFFGGEAATVGVAIEALIEGRLAPFTQDQTCGGGMG